MNQLLSDLVALDKLFPTPNTWIQHQSFDNKGGRCIMGGIMTVATRGFDESPRVQAMRTEIVATIYNLPTERVFTTHAIGYALDDRKSFGKQLLPIQYWNDDKDRTFEQVKEILAKAIARQLPPIEPRMLPVVYVAPMEVQELAVLA